MKKLLSTMVAVSVMASSAAAVTAASGSEMENALVSVKSVIDIPQELTVFESSTHTEDSKTSYTFSWHTEDYSSRINVTADSAGRISWYDYYYENLYSDTINIADKTPAEYKAAAEAFIKKAVPQMFVSKDDCLVEQADSGQISKNNTYTVIYNRSKDGLFVKDNFVGVDVKYTGSEFIITGLYANLDYDTEYAAYPENTISNPSAAYFEAYPLEKAYVKEWAEIYEDDTAAVRLVYRFKDYAAGYILAETGEKVEEDESEQNIYTEDSAGGESEMMAARDAGLTDAERTEIDNVSGLKSVSEIIQKAYDTGVFGELPAADEFSSYVSKVNDKYIVRLSYYNYDEKRPYASNSISMSADGKSGRLLSFNSYNYSNAEPEEYADSVYEAAGAATDKFLSENYGDELAACGEPNETRNKSTLYRGYKRLVNGIPYDNNYIYVTYDLRRDMVSSFYINWDDDTSSFTAPDNAISYDAALKAMESISPIKLGYVKVNGIYTPCYYADNGYIDIDALTGKATDNLANDEYEYTDIAGHWAEDIINTLARYGIGFNSAEFRPDEAITQSDLLRLIILGNYGYISDEKGMYDTAKRHKLISEEEIAPEAAVKREDAFVYIIRAMGLTKIASMSEIFKAGFSDDTEISADKVGTLAILRGYGIVTGDDVSVRPKDNITRAEAAALVYNYLKADK